MINKCEHGIYDGTRTDGKSVHCDLCWETKGYNRNGRWIGKPETRPPKPFDAKAAATANHITDHEERLYGHGPSVEDNYGDISSRFNLER